MKKLLFIFLAFFHFTFLFAQNDDRFLHQNLELPKENGKVTYQEVISATGVSADDLYNSTRLWFLDNFKYSKEVIQYENKETGIITGNGNTSMSIKSVANYIVENTIFFTVTVEVKEEKFRYKISNITVEQAAIPGAKTPIEEFFSEEWMYKKNGKPKEFMFDWYDAYITEIHRIEDSIQSTLKSNKFKKNSDW
jgi:hypothetical protein